MNFNVTLELNNTQRRAANEPEPTKLHVKNTQKHTKRKWMQSMYKWIKVILHLYARLNEKTSHYHQHISPSSAATLTFLFQTCDSYDITNDLLITLFLH